MEKAYNPSTGEVLFLVGDQWTKPEETAENPKTGERAYLVNNQWEVFKPPAADKPAPSKTKPAALAPDLNEIAPTGDIMGGDFGSAIMNAEKKESVLQGQKLPPIEIGRASCRERV